MTKLVRFDWAIKYLLRNKANFDILENFLSDLLNREIRIESLLESEGNKNTNDDKFNRVDVLARNEKDERIIIEVQATREWDYLSRILYGTSKVVTEHLKESEAYKNICKVISVSVVFFDMGQGEDYIYHGTTIFKGRHHHDILKLNEQERNFYGLGFETSSDIYPEYYILKVDQFHDRIRDKFDEWMYFLKNGAIKSNFTSKGIHTAAEKLNVLKLSESERKAYERYQENLHYETSIIESQKIEEYMRGKAEGKIQIQKEIAKCLKEEGLAAIKISKMTGLSEQEIKDL